MGFEVVEERMREWVSGCVGEGLMIKFFFSSKKQLFSKSNLHSPNLGPLLGLGFKVWRLGSRDKDLGFRV